MTPQVVTPAESPDQSAPAAGAAVVEWIARASDTEDLQPAVAALPHAGLRAVVVDTRPAAAAADVPAPRADLALLIVPAAPGDTGGLSARDQAWVEAGGAFQTIAIHGAVVAWSPHRAAILVEPGRIDAVRAAVVEFWLHERELAAIESDVAAGWPDVEADAPLAFEFRDRDAARRRRLGERFLRTVGLRARLCRLAPHLDRPPLHPPTLASQLGERLRERSRLVERAGFLDGQLEVQERVYEQCGQRSNDWALARKSTRLEWAIVVLLVVETVLILVESLR